MLLRQIKYFVTIVETNSFTEAAEKCYISQSAISQQMSALESELEVKLFIRSGRKFTITPAGEYFYERGKTLLSNIEKIKAKTKQIGQDNETTLNIGYLASYDGKELQNAIIEFAKIYPEVTVNIFKGTHEDLYFAINNGEANIVLNDQRRAFSDEYENFLLNQSPAYIEVSPTHPIASKDIVITSELENYPCILVANKDRQSTEQDFYENTLGIGKLFIFADSLSAAKLLAISGRGYLLVESTSNDETSPLIRKEVRRSDFSPIVRTYCAFWKKKNTTYYIEEFANILRNKFLEK
jgi:DNA-binding transcriptional LysR family regulator